MNKRYSYYDYEDPRDDDDEEDEEEEYDYWHSQDIKEDTDRLIIMNLLGLI